MDAKITKAAATLALMAFLGFAGSAIAASDEAPSPAVPAQNAEAPGDEPSSERSPSPKEGPTGQGFEAEALTAAGAKAKADASPAPKPSWPPSETSESPEPAPILAIVLKTASEAPPWDQARAAMEAALPQGLDPKVRAAMAARAAADAPPRGSGFSVRFSQASELGLPFSCATMHWDRLAPTADASGGAYALALELAGRPISGEAAARLTGEHEAFHCREAEAQTGPAGPLAREWAEEAAADVYSLMRAEAEFGSEAAEAFAKGLSAARDKGLELGDSTHWSSRAIALHRALARPAWAVLSRAGQMRLAWIVASMAAPTETEMRGLVGIKMGVLFSPPEPRIPGGRAAP